MRQVDVPVRSSKRVIRAGRRRAAIGTVALVFAGLGLGAGIWTFVWLRQPAPTASVALVASEEPIQAPQVLPEPSPQAPATDHAATSPGSGREGITIAPLRGSRRFEDSTEAVPGAPMPPPGSREGAEMAVVRPASEPLSIDEQRMVEIAARDTAGDAGAAPPGVVRDERESLRFQAGTEAR